MWWRHEMKAFSALLAFCARKSPVTDEFSPQRLVTRSFDVIFDLHLAQPLSKQWRRRWFETPSRSLWRHCNVSLRSMSQVRSIYLRSLESQLHPSLIILVVLGGVVWYFAHCSLSVSSVDMDVDIWNYFPMHRELIISSVTGNICVPFCQTSNTSHNMLPSLWRIMSHYCTFAHIIAIYLLLNTNCYSYLILMLLSYEFNWHETATCGDITLCPH